MQPALLDQMVCLYILHVQTLGPKTVLSENFSVPNLNYSVCIDKILCALSRTA